MSGNRNPVGDQRVREVAEREVVRTFALPTDEERAEAVVPAVGAFDDPTARFAAEPADEGRFTAPTDVALDAQDSESRIDLRIVVPFVHAAVLRAEATSRRDRSDRLKGRQSVPQVGHIGTADRKANRDTSAVRENVPFSADFRAVRGIRPRKIPPFGAFTRMASSEVQAQTIPLRLSYSFSTCFQSLWKTPVCTQRVKYRWQVAPEPNSRGNAFHWHPVRSRYTIPANTCRTGMRGRPPRGLGASTGINGATRRQRSSGTSENFASIPLEDHARSPGSSGF